MALWTQLKAAIALVIKKNGNGEITGNLLQAQLHDMIDNVGNYQFKGIATPTTDPLTPDGTAWYITGEAGTYTNFSNIVVNGGEIAFLKWDGATWTKSSITGFGGSSLVKYTDIISEEIINILSGTKLVSVNFKCTLGTAIVKIGTTSGGTDIMREKTILVNETLSSQIGKIFPVTAPIYISVTGGTVNITVEKIIGLL